MGKALYPLFAKKPARQNQDKGIIVPGIPFVSRHAEASASVAVGSSDNPVAVDDEDGTDVDVPLSSLVRKKKRRRRTETVNVKGILMKKNRIFREERAFIGLKETKRKQMKLSFYPAGSSQPVAKVCREISARSSEFTSDSDSANDQNVAIESETKTEASLKFAVKSSTQNWLNLTTPRIKNIGDGDVNSHPVTPEVQADVANVEEKDETEELEDILGIRRDRATLLDGLWKRSTCGTRLKSVLPSKRAASWKDSDLVSLQMHFGRRVPQLLAWDTVGVLLAVTYSDRTIAIYDWDMFVAAEHKSRKEQQRHKSPKCVDSQLGKFDVPPILVFKVPYLPETIVWNPHHADQLAVSFRNNSHIHLYRVDKISEWSQKNHGLRMTCPPSTTFADYYTPHTSEPASTILFLDSSTLLGCLGRAVCCWSLKSKCIMPYKLLWTLQNPSTITCAVSFGPRVVLMGSKKGHLMLVDWKATTRERTFSCVKITPTLLHEWKPHKRSYKSADNHRLGAMGIRKIFVEGDGPPSSGGWGCHRIFWVTECGWLLSAVISSPKHVDATRIWHISPKMVVKKCTGETVTQSQPAWSRPRGPIAAHSTSIFCWTGVPQVTRILPHPDHQVLNSGPSVIYSDDRTLMWLERPEDGVQKVVLPSSWYDIPGDVAVHPSQEWVVACDGTEVQVLLSR